MKREDLPAAVPSDTRAAWAALHADACAPYRRAGRWAWHWARGKLGRDPVFRGMLERGELLPGARVVDIGCGQGLLAGLLQACAEHQRQGRWPAAWPVQPWASSYTGIELMAKEVARADRALGGLPLAPRFVCADMRDAEIPPCELVVILDVLHYVDHAAQEALLRRVRSALLPRGRLLLRVGDAACTRRYRVSQFVDWVVTVVRGHAAPPTAGRPLAEWLQLLQGLGFVVHSLPQSQGTPFANVLLVADLRADA